MKLLPITKTAYSDIVANITYEYTRVYFLATSQRRRSRSGTVPEKPLRRGTPFILCEPHFYQTLLVARPFFIVSTGNIPAQQGMLAALYSTLHKASALAYRHNKPSPSSARMPRTLSR